MPCGIFEAGASRPADKVEGKLRTGRKIERLQVHRRYEYVIGRGKSASPVYYRPTFEYWNPIQIQVKRVAMKIHSRPVAPRSSLLLSPSTISRENRNFSTTFGPHEGPDPPTPFLHFYIFD